MSTVILCYLVSKDELVVPTKRKCSHLASTTLILMRHVAGMAYIRGRRLSPLSDRIGHHVFTPSLSVGKQDGFHWHAYLRLPSSGTLVLVLLMTWEWKSYPQLWLRLFMSAIARATAHNKQHTRMLTTSKMQFTLKGHKVYVTWHKANGLCEEMVRRLASKRSDFLHSRDPARERNI